MCNLIYESSLHVYDSPWNSLYGFTDSNGKLEHTSVWDTFELNFKGREVVSQLYIEFVTSKEALYVKCVGNTA